MSAKEATHFMDEFCAQLKVFCSDIKKELEVFGENFKERNQWLKTTG